MKIKGFIKTLVFVLSALIMSNCGNKNTETKKTEIMKNKNEIIVDVRSTEEWEFDGHADCSVNYPLDEIPERIEELKKYDHVTLVCRSGNRAGIAKRILDSAGVKNVENLGPWQNIVCNN